MKLFVDFDKTLTTGAGDRWWVDPFDETPNESMIELVNELYRREHTVVIYTARRERVRPETTMWLDRWNVHYHALVMEKPGYDLLIDDRVMQPGDALEAGADAIENVETQ